MVRETRRPRKPADGSDDDVRRRVVDAALDLAAIEGWSHLRMARIASAAGVTLAQLHALFPAKCAILDAFVRRIDDEVLAAGPADAGEPARDRLFDVLMRRFDAMAPRKAAVAAIIRDCLDPAVGLVGLPLLARSMAWALEAAGVGGSGLGWLLRVQGLTLIYANAVGVWLRDDSPDMAKTMAALDKGLRRAESVVGFFAGRRGAAEATTAGPA